MRRERGKGFGEEASTEPSRQGGLTPLHLARPTRWVGRVPIVPQVAVRSHRLLTVVTAATTLPGSESCGQDGSVAEPRATV